MVENALLFDPTTWKWDLRSTVPQMVPQKETMHDDGGWVKGKATAEKSPSYSMSTMLIALGKR